MERFTVRENGFAGLLYPGERGTDTIVIFTGGAACTEKVSVKASTFLREAGFTVFVLGFYLWKDTPKDLVQIPVDYVEKAVAYLKDRFHPEKIYMTGASTGAGYTLLSASLVSDLDGVAAIVPFDYVMEASSFTKRYGKSVYSYHGEDVPYSSNRIVDDGLIAVFRKCRKAGYPLRRIMRFGYDQAELTEEGRIKTENINGDILLIGAKNDDCWPSDIAVPRIEQNLKDHDFKHYVRALVYDPASHALGGDYEKTGFMINFLMKLMMKIERTDPEGCNQARRNCEAEMIRFFEGGRI